ncbi:hypothetical protein TIFTF001_038988 [Ficus carica]|uniref:Uncharacterized protein n=1 Tax=Ficus carica TaxID=3494 RepID=A0AA88E8P6_FICCA|nr:hypothetical protein TIFTF001_038988 [Ficus carica]
MSSPDAIHHGKPPFPVGARSSSEIPPPRSTIVALRPPPFQLPPTRSVQEREVDGGVREWEAPLGEALRGGGGGGGGGGVGGWEVEVGKRGGEGRWG